MRYLLRSLPSRDGSIRCGSGRWVKFVDGGGGGGGGGKVKETEKVWLDELAGDAGSKRISSTLMTKKLNVNVKTLTINVCHLCLGNKTGQRESWRTVNVVRPKRGVAKTGTISMELADTLRANRLVVALPSCFVKRSAPVNPCNHVT